MASKCFIGRGNTNQAYAYSSVLLLKSYLHDNRIYIHPRMHTVTNCCFLLARVMEAINSRPNGGTGKKDANVRFSLTCPEFHTTLQPLSRELLGRRCCHSDKEGQNPLDYREEQRSSRV